MWLKIFASFFHGRAHVLGSFFLPDCAAIFISLFYAENPANERIAPEVIRQVLQPVAKFEA
jgi:hypothetical protein